MSSCGKNENPQEMNRRKFLKVFGGGAGSPDKPGGLSIQLCKSEKKEFYIRYSS